jgi:hypothetical protein
LHSSMLIPFPHTGVLVLPPASTTSSSTINS